MVNAILKISTVLVAALIVSCESKQCSPESMELLQVGALQCVNSIKEDVIGLIGPNSATTNLVGPICLKVKGALDCVFQKVLAVDCLETHTKIRDILTEVFNGIKNAMDFICEDGAKNLLEFTSSDGMNCINKADWMSCNQYFQKNAKSVDQSCPSCMIDAGCKSAMSTENCIMEGIVKTEECKPKMKEVMLTFFKRINEKISCLKDFVPSGATQVTTNTAIISSVFFLILSKFFF